MDPGIIPDGAGRRRSLRATFEPIVGSKRHGCPVSDGGRWGFISLDHSADR
jgi:hypothetical protein